MSHTLSQKGFAEISVVAFESRRAVEMAKLIEHAGGRALVGPTIREAPCLGNDREIVAFGEALLSGNVEAHVCLTGVGTRMLLERLETRWPRERIVHAMNTATVVVRGPKPVRVLNEYGIRIGVRALEPNTWREIVAELDRQQATVPLAGRTVWIQEYGLPNAALCDALRVRGATVHTVKVYGWELPEDVSPLAEVLRHVATGAPKVALFTSAQQVAHMVAVARHLELESAVRAAFLRIVIGSIGPTCTEALEAHGLRADFEPSHSKMGLLVSELADTWKELVRNS